jgi:c-di-GMP-binding flagellar brake protein YcgR
MEQSDRRQAPRVANIIEIHYTSNSPPLTARLSDLSERGVFVDVGNPLPVGATLSFKFYLRTISSDPIEGQGKVIWRQETVGMGIEFLDLKDEDRAKIKRFIFLESQG